MIPSKFSHVLFSLQCKIQVISEAWWNKPLIPALKRLKQKDEELGDQPGLYNPTLEKIIIVKNPTTAAK